RSFYRCRSWQAAAVLQGSESQPRGQVLGTCCCNAAGAACQVPPVACRRWLNLQEYQSKKLMSDNGVRVQRFFVASTAREALEAAKRLNAKEIVLKAQILAGGRGKGVFNSGLKGGVHLTKDPKVVGQLAKQMIGYNLATKQTSKEGVKVNKVMVAEALDISRETYLAILMDRSCNGPVLVGSPQGGVDIEEVAASNPELIFKVRLMAWPCLFTDCYDRRRQTSTSWVSSAPGGPAGHTRSPGTPA
ncbi:hypothetical protein H1C71_041921, partial [Ictidomys tridecemlineatus]